MINDEFFFSFWNSSRRDILSIFEEFVLQADMVEMAASHSWVSMQTNGPGLMVAMVAMEVTLFFRVRLF